MPKRPDQPRRAPVSLFLVLAALIPMVAQSQSATARSTQQTQANSQIIAVARRFQESNQATAVETIRKQLERASCELSPPPVGTVKLVAEEIRRRAQQAHLRVGWVYQCIKCDEWHVNLACGYALTTNGAVATCYHVINPPRDIRAGALVAVDHRERLFPVMEVLAANRYADACIVQVKGEGFTPLPLNTNVSVGSAAYFLSDAQGDGGSITPGIVMRFLKLPERRLENVRGAPRFTPLRIQVNVIFGPGSSGSAVLDECGNAIGHASTVTHQNPASPSDDPPPQSISHEATSARDVFSLMRITK